MPDSPAPSPSPKTQPVHEVRLGTVKAAIWKNETDGGIRYNVTFERLYTQDGEWRSTSSFGRDELLLLGKVTDLAHTWIMHPEPKEEQERAVPKGRTSGSLAGKSLPKRQG